MNQLHAGQLARPAVRLTALLATLIAVAATFIVLAPQANADPPDLMTLNSDNCTMTLEDGYQYKPEGAQDYLEAGTYPAGLFYGSQQWQAREAGTQEPVEMNQVDVPVDCLVSATASCGAVTFVGHLPIGADPSDFGVKYGDRDEEVPDGEFDFGQAQWDAGHDGYVMRIETDRDSLYWMQSHRRGIVGGGSLEVHSTQLPTDCDRPADPEETDDSSRDKAGTDSPEPDEAAIPTAAPRSGV